MSSSPQNAKAKVSFGRLIRLPETGSFIGFVVVYIFFAILGGAVFVGAPGWSSWLNIAAEVGIIALPVGLLMIAGEFDISVGSIVPASSMTVAMLSGHYDLPATVGILGGLAVGVSIGFVNGLLVTRTTIPSLIVTIGVMFAVMGLTLGFVVLLKGSTSVSYVPHPTAKFLLGQFINYMFSVAFFFYILHISPWGNWIFAMGGDQESARNSGIPTNRLKIALFMLSAMSAALVGMNEVVLANTASTTTQFGMIFNTIICVVVGGVLLTGGFGTVTGTIFGTLTFGIVFQGINFTAFDKDLNMLFIGALLLIAVLMNDTFRNLATSASTTKKK